MRFRNIQVKVLIELAALIIIIKEFRISNLKNSIPI